MLIHGLQSVVYKLVFRENSSRVLGFILEFTGKYWSAFGFEF